MLNFLWENLASLTILKLVDVKLFPDCSFENEHFVGFKFYIEWPLKSTKINISKNNTDYTVYILHTNWLLLKMNVDNPSAGTITAEDN
jgi:hypothetical protein